MIDFGKIRPKIINYEEQNLVDKYKLECRKMLVQKGYTLFNQGRDICAMIL